MVLLNGSNIKKMFLDETLFENVSFNVDSADKIGFVGANGAGKSTLIKILMGEIEADGGEIFKNRFIPEFYGQIGYCNFTCHSLSLPLHAKADLPLFRE